MKDINIPRLEDDAPLPPFEERVAGQIDWIRYYIATTEARLSSRIAALTVAVVALSFAVGALTAAVVL